MKDLLRLNERIKIALEMGESHFREFKSTLEGPPEDKLPRDVKEVCSDIAQTLVAFANADGGELIVGIEDDLSVSGIQYNDNSTNALLNSPKSNVHESTPLPTVKASIVEFEGKKVIYFSIPKGSEHVYITSTGLCLQRKDLESVPIPPEQIKFEREEIKSREYDRQFIDNADITDLDSEILSYVAGEFSKTISPEKYLQHMDLAEFDGTKLRLRRAALLLFASNPQKWHPRPQVRILKISGTELKSGKEFNVTSDEEVNENIFKLIENSWELLRPYLTETKFSPDAIFKSQIIYPELACREALINAIAHRDYNIEGRGIEVFIFDDRLEIKSPGELLSSIKIRDLIEKKGVHQSRNTHIARVLREIGYMRELGEGFKRIFELMEQNDLTQPDLVSSSKSFTIKLHQKFIYTPEEKIWLENFKEIPLSREQRTVIRLGAKGELISPKTIWNVVGIVDTDDYRQLIESLRNMGLLESKVSKPEALKIARKKKITDKKSIPRFLIKIPSSEKVIEDEKVDTKIEVLDDSEYAKIFIENLPYNVTEQDIYMVFSTFGEISDIHIPINYETGKGRGFAFIEFDSMETVKRVFKNKYKIYLKGRKTIVKEFRSKF